MPLNADDHKRIDQVIREMERSANVECVRFNKRMNDANYAAWRKLAVLLTLDWLYATFLLNGKKKEKH